MGIRILHNEARWLEPDADLAADLREKRRLLADRHDEVLVELSESRPAQAEVLRMVVAAVESHHAAHYAHQGIEISPRGAGSRGDDEVAPLECAGALVQEDFCLMERGREQWRLTAGCVCFPTRWHLAPKLGQSLRALHDPVPGYAERLASSADRFFDHLPARRIVWRTNWSLVDDPALFLPPGHRSRPPPADSLDAVNAGDRVFLRMERQTLRRLPESDAILFGIRVYRNPLRDFRGDPEAARKLWGALDTMERPLQRYKSLCALRPAAQGYLAELVRASPDLSDGDATRETAPASTR